MSTAMSVGFVGVGGIGRPMALRLSKSPHRLTVCDRAPEARAVFDRIGVPATDRVADCAGLDLVIFMVANDAQLRAAALGPEGLLHAINPARPPRVAVMSSVLPATVIDVAAALAQKNVATVDAPVSGGGIRAADGTLTIMVGGSEHDLDAIRPVMTHLGSSIRHCGPLGSGEAVKIVNNIIGVTNLFLMTEAMHVAERLGMDPEWLAGVMDVSSGRNSATRDYPSHRRLYGENARSAESMRAVVDVTRKDLVLAQSLARQAGVSTPILDAVSVAHDGTPYDELLMRWKSLAAKGEEA